MPNLAPPLALVLLLAACAPLRPLDRPAPRTVAFRCQTGGAITVAFTDRRARLVEADGRVVELPQRPAGSGFWYEGQAGALRGKGSEATWMPANGQPRACVAAPSVAPATAAALDGTRWRLQQFESSDDAQGVTRPDDPARYTLEFGGDRAAMRLDCNRASAAWRATPSGATGGALAFGPVAMTRAACPPGSLDTRIARDLPRVRSYTLAGDTLNLALEADGGIYTWRRAS